MGSADEQDELELKVTDPDSGNQHAILLKGQHATVVRLVLLSMAEEIRDLKIRLQLEGVDLAEG